MKGFIFFFIFTVTNVFAYDIITYGGREYLLVPYDSSPSLESLKYDDITPIRTKRDTTPKQGKIDWDKFKDKAIAEMEADKKFPFSVNHDYVKVNRNEAYGRGTLTRTDTLFENDNHKLIGSTSFSGGKAQPYGFGGGVDYTHNPSATTLSARANHVMDYGTNVGLSARHDFINEKNTKAYLGVNYDQSFGGPYGNGRPNYGVFAGINHRF